MVKTCKHLQPILEHEFQRGNEIITATTWGDYDVVYFKKKLDSSMIKNNLLRDSIVYKVNRDPHYLLEEFHCEYHKKSIMGPLR